MDKKSLIAAHAAQSKMMMTPLRGIIVCLFGGGGIEELPTKASFLSFLFHHATYHPVGKSLLAAGI